MTEETEWTVSQESYDEAFKLKKGDANDKEIYRKAFEVAVQTRKFEIELYWKRATYFWILIAAMFVAYFSVVAAKEVGNYPRYSLAFIIACSGFFFTFSWFLVNKGSKFWQENWENHIDLLEDGNVGPLFKIILTRAKDKDKQEPCSISKLIRPQSYSVSKINQLVNLYTLMVWGMLALISIILLFSTLENLKVSGLIVFVCGMFFILTLFACCLICKDAKTDLPSLRNYQFDAVKRKPQIAFKESSSKDRRCDETNAKT